MDQLKITVITVCYNTENSILDTLESVQKQTYEDIEYIVKDGRSTDHTLELLKSRKKEYSFMLYSDKDSGIYDAMNIAVGYATGDYVIFVNAGDVLADAQVIEKTVQALEEKKYPDIIYGNIIFTDAAHNKNYRKYAPVCGRKRYYVSGDAICHQAIFAKRKCLSETPFLLSYKICADREWVLRMIEKKKVFCYQNQNICICEIDGFSLQNQKLYEAEVRECIRKHFSIGYIMYCLLCCIKKCSILLAIMRWFEKKIFYEKNR